MARVYKANSDSYRSTIELKYLGNPVYERGQSLMSLDGSEDQAASLRLIPIGIISFLTMVIVGPLMSEGNDAGQGNVLRQLIYIGIFVSAIVASHKSGLRFKLAVIPLSIVFLLGFCLLSMVWAIDPASTVRRWVLTSVVIYTIFLFVSQINFRQAADLIRFVILVALLANIATVLVAPGFGIHQAADVLDPSLIGDWRGFMMQKNFLGALSAIGVLYFAFGPSVIPTPIRIAVCFLGIFLLLMTGSKTSLGILGLALACGLCIYRYNPRFKPIVIAFLAFVFLSITFGVDIYWNNIVVFFSSPDSLTGRVQIWPVLLAYVNDHWPLGAGYGSFWNIGPNSPIFEYTKPKSWIADLDSGHNGYIDLLVQIGPYGLCLAIVAMIVLPVNQVLTQRSMDGGQRALILAALVFCAGHNLTESNIFDRDQIVQVFWIFAIAFMHHHKTRLRSQ